MERAQYIAAIFLMGLAVMTRVGGEPVSAQPGSEATLQMLPPGDDFSLQADSNNDWLLRSYERQLQTRRGDPSGDADTNPFNLLSSDKNLAKLTGLPLMESPPQEQGLSFRTGVSPSAHDAMALRVDSTPMDHATAPYLISAFKPFVAPLDASDAAGQPSIYASLPSATPMVPAPPPTPPPAPPSPPPQPLKADEATELSAMQTPGQVAAESDPLWDKTASDLTLDMPPKESARQDELPQENAARMEPPLKAAPLPKRDKVAQSLPGVVKAAPVPPRLLQVKLPPNPTPAFGPSRGPGFPVTNPFFNH